MTASTDFLPFATGPSANVSTQTDWASDPVVTNGMSSGIASSAKFNKAFRQGTFGTAAIAQLIVNLLGVSVPDDGDLDAFIANFQAAITKFQYDDQLTPGTTNVTVPTWATHAEIEIIGGGGGGGSSASGFSGGGGGAGGYAQGTVSVTPGATISVTVGAAGAGGSSGAGSAGGTSTFGALASATGGAGGGANSGASPGGNGGTSTGTGLRVFSGSDGGDGNGNSSTSSQGGDGAAGPKGGAGRTGFNAGISATAPGSGGGGAWGGSGSGGSGAPGAVLIKWLL